MVITAKNLHAAAALLNDQLGRPREPWTREPLNVEPSQSGKYRANIGCIHVEQQGGAYQLSEMRENGGTVTLYSGTAREVYAFIRGMSALNVGDYVRGSIIALDNASPPELDTLMDVLLQICQDHGIAASKRVIARAFRGLVRVVK